MSHIHFRASRSSEKRREGEGSTRGGRRSRVKAFFRSCFLGHTDKSNIDNENEKIPNARETTHFHPHYQTKHALPPSPPPSQPQQQIQYQQPPDQTTQYLPPIRQTTPISLSGTTIQAKPLRKPWKHLPRPSLKKHHSYNHQHRSSLKTKLPLLTFPPEILLIIASNLDLEDQRSLLLASRSLAILITPLYQHTAMLVQGFNPSLDFPPLHWASWKGHTSLVQQLLDQGHDTNARTLVHGTTPLHHAARWGHEEVVELLLRRGAEVDAQDTFDGKTPLHLARLEGRVEVCNLLVAAGASVTIRDDAGRTPMAYMGGSSCEDYHWRPRDRGEARLSLGGRQGTW